ncbi:hypothetical protein K501DRAFT_280065 [Backusella circina FSU 941]|nr:hypothetical protein K501DRAFT_280065 [Backusella circina FSU 941]
MPEAELKQLYRISKGGWIIKTVNLSKLTTLKQKNTHINMRFVTLTTIAVAVLIFASHDASALPVNSIKEIAGSRQELSSFSKRQMGIPGGSGNGGGSFGTGGGA